MGSYVPSSQRKKTSLTEALVEAEESHLLDCPTAGPVPRIAATVLDVILGALWWKAVEQFSGALAGPLATLYGALFETSGFFGSASAFGGYVAALLKIAGLFAANVWALSYFGGSVGKLLLGLRVIDALTGQRLGIGRALVRELIGKGIDVVTLLIGSALAAIRPDRRALHDILFRTVVKKLLDSR